MSVLFEVGDETVWNPSNGAARLFHGQVAVFEAELGVPSGIGPLENDACRIDPAVLGVFAEALVGRHGYTGHSVIRALSEGFVATVLVLAERAGAGVLRPPLPGSPLEGARDVQVPSRFEALREADLREAARELSRAMPR